MKGLGARRMGARSRVSVHRSIVAALVALIVSAMPLAALAHDTTPGVLALEEQDDGRYVVAFRVPVDTRVATADDVAPRFPAHCTQTGTMLDCGARGLDGPIVIEGLEGSRMRVVVVIRRAGAEARETIVDASTPSVAVDAHTSVVAWIALGVEHVLLGLDHLAFLLGLLLVSTLDRRLLLTITAFTLAHSVTLGLAVLEVVRPSSALVEAAIALSVLLVAREALRETPTSMRRAPWAVAAVFGLVHGLGLAGALREVGLPRANVVPALFGFNVGVEIGQLTFVGACALMAYLARGREWVPRARVGMAYAIGGAAAYWLIVRTGELGGG